MKGSASGSKMREMLPEAESESAESKSKSAESESKYSWKQN